MQYTLIIKDANARTILEMDFDLWSTVRVTAGNLERGYSTNGEYDIQIYDNFAKQIAYSTLSKTKW